MQRWLEHLDAALGKYPHFLSAIESLSAFAAVITSLVLAVLAKRENRTRLRARASIMELIQPGVSDPPDYLTVSVTNTGLMPLRIPVPCFAFRVPFKRSLGLVIPLDSARRTPYLAQRHYPITVEPRSSETLFMMTGQQLHENIAQQRNGLPKWKRHFFRFTKAILVTQDGYVFTVKAIA